MITIEYITELTHCGNYHTITNNQNLNRSSEHLSVDTFANKSDMDL